ncbi:hypothetical protein PF327_07015 [Sulfurovum sp. XTW-4]|uniref:Uncharacterized protein n=1 Tax=Sulfurovum xiamenensis TaxID=3019066 RepID=A0ABT7QSB4_9BACT|nr:hypothetical protein [Sulfurovum xiamenensis]MDM5263946.1 hypothetical protein [Sulfurovum xiamenensis]
MFYTFQHQSLCTTANNPKETNQKAVRRFLIGHFKRYELFIH